jgi:YHS domain-containing protein
MSKVFILLLCFVLAVVIFACKSEQKAESEMQEQEQVTTVEPDTGQATCPVCGMTMAKADMIAYEVEGETYYFCSDSCKDQYLTQLKEEEEFEEPETEEE